MPPSMFHNIIIKSVAFAAEQKIKMPQYYFGKANHQGMHEQPKNNLMAIKWFERAANKGHGSAMFYLGCLLPDKVEAYKWLYLTEPHGEREAERAKNELAKYMTANQVYIPVPNITT